MGWNASIVCDCCKTESHDFSFTHNTNKMIHSAMEWDSDHKPWFDVLHGLTAWAGAIFLQTIIKQLEKNPAKFRAMNPANGWGDFDSLLGVLRDMHQAGSTTNNAASWRTCG